MVIDSEEISRRFDYFEKFSLDHLKILSIFRGSVKRNDTLEDTIDIANQVLWRGLKNISEEDIKSQIYIFRKDCVKSCQNLFKSNLEEKLESERYFLSDRNQMLIPIKFIGNNLDYVQNYYGDFLLGVVVVENPNILSDADKDFLIEYAIRVEGVIYRNTIFEILENKNIEMEEFCAQVGHDLNNRVTGVRGFSEIMINKLSSIREEPLSVIREDLDLFDTCASYIYSNSLRIEDIIDLLSFGEINPKIVKDRAKEFNLYQFMNEYFLTHMRINSHIPSLNRYHLILSIDKELVYKNIKFDTKFLTIIFDNLIGNAIKYTPESGIILSGIYGQNDNVTFDFLNSLKESIPDQDLVKIKNKGVRGQNHEYDRDYFGLNYGLGLYMVEKLVRKGLLGKMSLSSSSSLDISKAFNEDLKRIDYFGDSDPIGINIGNFFRVEINVPKGMIL